MSWKAGRKENKDRSCLIEMEKKSAETKTKVGKSATYERGHLSDRPVGKDRIAIDWNVHVREKRLISMFE